MSADFDNHRVHVVAGGKRLANTRHQLDAANLTLPQWREQWQCARDHMHAIGSGDEPFGNLTITVNTDGQVSLRLPKPLEQLANAPHGRYILSGRAAFTYRADEWRARITGGQSMSYTISGKPGRAGRYLTANWACPQATPDDRQVSTRNRHQPETRGTKSRQPGRTSTRSLGRATVTPAPANNGQPRK